MIMIWGRIHPHPTIVGWGVLLLLDKKVIICIILFFPFIILLVYTIW